MPERAARPLPLATRAPADGAMPVAGPHDGRLSQLAGVLNAGPTVRRLRALAPATPVIQRAQIGGDGKWYCDPSTGITTAFDTRAEAELAERTHASPSGPPSGAPVSGAPLSGAVASSGTVASGDPVSVDAAEQEIARIEAQLGGQGILLVPPARPSRPGKTASAAGTALDSIANKALPTVLAQHGLSIDPGRSPLPAGTIMQLLNRLVALRKWRDAEQARSGAFGYGAVPSFALPQSSPLATTYGFTPFAPDLHGRPIGFAPSGSTFEQVGDDMMMRGKPERDLRDDRDRSRAYRAPSKKHSVRSTPPYPPTISGAHGTILDQQRMTKWRHENRKKEAASGPFKGNKWPDQKAQMGKMSAQDAVYSYNATVDVGARLSTSVPYEWLHLFAFSMGGHDDVNPQEAGNLVVGTQFANLYHAAFEKAAKALASEGHRVQVHSRPLDPVSVEWRIYRHIHYSISILKTVHFSMFGPVTVPAATMSRTIRCLEKPQVHTSDPDALKHEILRELGIITPEYGKAVDTALSAPPPSGAAGGHGGPSSGSTPSAMSEADEDERDPLMRMALRMSVQDAAQRLGVDRAFHVGHADGQDDNCSILSAFAAAGHGLSREEAIRLRALLVTHYHIPADGPLDLGDPWIARAIADLLQVETGTRRTIVVIRPNLPSYAETPVAGSGPPVYLFYFGAHFSPAHRR